MKECADRREQRGPERLCHSEDVRPKNLVFRKNPVFQEKILRHVVPQDDTDGPGSLRGADGIRFTIVRSTYIKSLNRASPTVCLVIWCVRGQGKPCPYEKYRNSM